MPLVACPFCREAFPRGERKLGTREACPVCGVALVSLAALAKSPRPAEASAEDGTEAETEPEWEPLPVLYAGRRRGPLAAVAVLGIIAFLAPWVHVTMPDVVTYTGIDIARRLGWAWAAGVAWFVSIPIVLSRRSIMQMRGARVAVAFLAAIPGTTAALLLLRPPHGSYGVPLRFDFAWGVYATLAISVVGVLLAISFGGRVDDIPVKRGTSSGQVVH